MLLVIGKVEVVPGILLTSFLMTLFGFLLTSIMPIPMDLFIKSYMKGKKSYKYMGSVGFEPTIS